MFERMFKAILLQFLGDFVEDLDDKDLRVDNWSGQVTQNCLNLRPTSLRFLSMALGMDIKVIRGVLGKLQVSFNWRALWKEPIQITLEDLYIVCTASSEPDPSIFLASKRNKNRAKIEDMQMKTKFMNPNKTYFQQLKTTIADNLCVSLKNVHIRYEDSNSNPLRPFVIGLTLEKLNYSPADSNWKKSFVTLEAKKLAQKSFMLLELSQFSIYHISKCTDMMSAKPEWIKSITNDKFSSLMYPFIAHRDSLPQISEYYLLKPVKAEIRIRRSLKPPLESEIPKVSVSILVDDMACALETSQYQDLLMLRSIISLHKAVGIHINLRPTQRPKSKTRDWWIYVLERVRYKLRRKLRPKTFEYLKLRKEHKLEYISVYKHLLVKEYEQEYGRSIGSFQKITNLASLSIHELENRLLAIEDDHSAHEIYLFRCVAERELSVLKEKKKGWIDWGRGWFTNNSAEEENFLKSLVEYSELISMDEQSPMDYTKSFIHFFLNKCSISLDGRHANGSRVSFLKISLNQATVHRSMTTSLTKIFAVLSSLTIIDPFTPIEKFKKLFTPKNVDESYYEGNMSYEAEEEIFPEENDGFPEFARVDAKQEPLFKLEFDRTKTDDMSLKATLQPLEIVYNAFCIQRISECLKIPEALAIYESIEIETMNQLSKWRNKTQERLKLLMKRQLNINIDVTISAPLIIIPENTLNEDTCQVHLNTGDLRITSKPREFSLSSLANRKASDIEENTYYDDYDIEITDISVALLPPESTNLENIIEKFNIHMQASKPILPKDPDLISLKLEGDIQSLTLRLSKMQYIMLRQYSSSTEISQDDQSDKPEISVEYKPPAYIDDESDDDDVEFFDAAESLEELSMENVKFPYDKKHLSVNFSIKALNVVVVDSNEDKDQLTLTARNLAVDFIKEEAKNSIELKLGYILIKDWIEQREVVFSHEDSSELTRIELVKFFENHPDYPEQVFHTQCIVSISNLHLNYYNRIFYLELTRFVVGSFQIPNRSMPKINSNFKAEIILQNVSCKVSDEAQDISELHLQFANIYSDSSQNLTCQIGQVTIKDFIRDALFFESLNSDLIQLKIENHQETDERYLQCQVNSFKITMAADMIIALCELYSNSLMKKYIKPQGSSQSKPYKSIYLQVEHPLFEFLSNSPSQGTCDFDMGMLEFQKNSDEIVLSMSESSVYTLVTEAQELFKDNLLSNFHIKISVDLPNICCEVPLIFLASSLKQLKFVKAIYEDYFEKLEKISSILNSNDSIDSLHKPRPSSDLSALPLGKENEELNIKLVFEYIDMTWFIIVNPGPSNEDLSEISGKLKNVQINLVKKPSSKWFKLQVEAAALNYKSVENIQILFTQSQELLTLSLQVVEKKLIADINLNSPRIVITPLSLQAIMHLAKEFNNFKVKSNGTNSELVLSGDVRNLQVIVTNDLMVEYDEEHVQYALDSEIKRFCMLQVSGQFQNASASCNEFFVVVGKTAAFTEEIIGKHLIHPLTFTLHYTKELSLAISEVNIDFSLSQIHFFKDILSKFSSLEPSQESETTSIKKPIIHLTIQQLLISISHDYSAAKGSNSTYFMIQLDYPIINLDRSIEFNTSLSLFYFNQQYLDWEPLIEKSDILLKYSIQGKPITFELKVIREMNMNISSALISSCSNFWSGIKDYNLIENISSPTHKLITRIHSGFAIRNETGHKMKYYIDNRSFNLNNLEEQSLDFEEVEEESHLAPVIMFKTNMKAKKAYKTKKLNLKLGEIVRLNDVCIDKLGSKVYGFNYKGNHYQIICEVTSRHGDNLLTVRSPISIKNMLKEPLDIRLIFPVIANRSSEDHYTNSVPLPPQSTVPLPIELLGFTDFQLKIKGYNWSSKRSINIIKPTVIECEQKPINSYDARISLRRDANEGHKRASAVLRVQQDEVKDENEKFYVKIYSFESPFVLENCLCCDLEYFCYVQNSDVRPHGLLYRGETFNCLEIAPSAQVSLALRIPGYDKTNYLEVYEGTKQIFQFSKKHSEQVNVVLEASTNEGMLKIVLFSQYWLENHTGLPLLFKYMENEQNYDVISLPYVVEGVYLEERSDKKKGLTQSMFAVYGEKLDIEEETVKPWMKYTESKKLGLSCLLEDEEIIDEGQGTIRMFSSDVNNPVAGTVSIKLANSHWSKVFKLTGNESKTILASSEHSIKALEATKLKRKCIYEVAMTMNIAEQPYSRTKIIRFTPRFVMINKMVKALLISQHEPDQDFNGVCRLIPNERSAFHWPDSNKNRSVCLRIDDYGWQWSGAFFIECPDDLVIRVRNSHTHEEVFVHITMTLEENTLHVILQDISHMPPYRIENLSMETLVLQQLKAKVPEKILKPFEVCGYAWDEPMLKKVLVASITGPGMSSWLALGKFKFERQKGSKPIHLKAHGSHPSHPLYVEVTNSGSTKVLIFRHDLKEEDDIKNNRESNSDDLSISITMDCLGISLINSKPEEIIYASFTDVRCQLDKSSSEIHGDFSIKSGQIDNQIYKALNPILLNMIDNSGNLIRIKFKKRNNVVIFT